MDYDAIIVGAGLGGCAAGCGLAGAGKKVLILERMGKVGGRCSSEEREGFKLDLGCHGLAGADHGSQEEALRRVGKEGAVKWHYMKSTTIKVLDTEINVARELTIKTKGKDTITFDLPAAGKEMKKMMPPQLMSMGTGMMNQMMPMIAPMMAPVAEQFDEVSFKEFFDKFVKWPVFKDVMELLQFSMFGTPSHMTAISELIRTMLGMMEYMKPGMPPSEIGGYPKGGLIALPAAMCEGIQEKGGEIRLNCNVKRVVVEGGKAVGVELEDGEIINAPVIVSNAGIRETVADMVGNDQFDAGYAETIDKLIPGVSAFCLRGALDQKITDLEIGICIPVGGLEDYYHKLWDEYQIPDIPPPIMFNVPSNMDPNLVPEGKQLVIAIGALMFESKDDFSKMEPLAMESVEHVIPGFKEHLMWHDFLNPNTYIAFGEKLAPAIGIAQCIGQVGPKRPSSISPIEGLYYVGGEAGTNISGIATDMCTKSGLACADYIIKSGK